MRKKQMRIVITVAVVVLILAGIGVYAATNAGTASDPLVSMSYITDTLTPRLQQQFDEQLDAKVQQLQQSFVDAVSNTGGFVTVNMTSGQRLTCSAGSEIMLVSGSVQAANDNMLSDVTAGASLAAEADLETNHLYLAASAGICVTSANNSTVMVRGTATVS